MTKKALTIFLSLILLLPVLIYFMVWNYYAINIPKFDDHALKEFILYYSQASSWKEKIWLLFKQHNEHRISLTRLISWWDYSLFGSLNYRHLMTAGNLLLLAVIPLWYELLKKNKKPLSALLPVPFLWLTLAFWENMYWGMAAIQNFGVVTLAVWTLYLCINFKTLPFVISLILAGVTILTSGNGLLVLPLGALLLFLTGNRKRFALWLVVSAVEIFCYFNWYTKPESNPESKATIFQFIKGYMAFLGSFAESFPVADHIKVCFFMGIVLFLVAISIVSTTLFRIVRNKYSQKFERITDLFCLGTILFILATALIVVYSRAGFGFDTLVTSRYKIYSVLLLIVAYLYVVIPIRGSFLSPYVTSIVFLGVIFNIFSYHYHLVDAYNLRKELTTSQFNWTFTDKELKSPADTSFAANIVEKTPVFYNKLLPLISVADRQTYAGNSRGLTELYDRTTFKAGEENLTIENNTFTSQRLQDSGIYILLSSKERYYLFPALRTRNTSRKELFLKQYYFAPGFRANIPFSEMDKGLYDVALIRQQGDQTGILFQNQKVRVKETKKKTVKVNW
ncbi:hypothetical protein [Dyadobacter chenhuakuii]|uniref:Uncharacterized protein n=1 Tax=Dyadobacter chenhuakuii TaxID=2909339 RepID=A0A9X1QB74_9BACT|nr:hypothetical protein [Dyadobacter chenhuakuii]MCF2492291.1 hypothetical protein [Dyadobacter chenhuakuii]MCF2497277.1 hypothetical protein [Dyadobacter chenhuakuii]USJ33403.1 hypothetical protein NFI80_11780 [Dyadobacter chenhuakuii]